MATGAGRVSGPLVPQAVSSARTLTQSRKERMAGIRKLAANVNTGVHMEERQFYVLADAALRRIEDAVESCGADVDLEVKPGGVLELEFQDGSKIIINRHTAAREIWLAARSGGYHFRADGDRWVGTRDGEELMAAIARCMSEQAGEAVTLA